MARGVQHVERHRLGWAKLSRATGDHHLLVTVLDDSSAYPIAWLADVQALEVGMMRPLRPKKNPDIGGRRVRHHRTCNLHSASRSACRIIAAKLEISAVLPVDRPEAAQWRRWQ